jgi:hypothetical protein
MKRLLGLLLTIFSFIDFCGSFCIGHRFCYYFYYLWHGFSKSFHYSTYFSSILSKSYHYSTSFLPYLPHPFTIQLTFLPYFPYHFTIGKQVIMLHFKRCGLKKYGKMKCLMTSCTRKTCNVDEMVLVPL